jgi:RimJ/RimL family protein N-acetyltransferase
MSDVCIETGRLILRDWREGDAAAFFEGTNTPAVMRWLGGVMDDAGKQSLLDRVAACSAANGFCFWIVERKADGAILGFCGLKRADAPGSSVTGEMEVGWRLREDAWGQGYAKEAATATLDAAFGRFGAAEVVALTVIENTGSWGLMERLGMRRRPDLDYPDPRFEWPLRDTIVYSIDKITWENR